MVNNVEPKIEARRVALNSIMICDDLKKQCDKQLLIKVVKEDYHITSIEANEIIDDLKRNNDVIESDGLLWIKHSVMISDEGKQKIKELHEWKEKRESEKRSNLLYEWAKSPKAEDMNNGRSY